MRESNDYIIYSFGRCSGELWTFLRSYVVVYESTDYRVSANSTAFGYNRRSFVYLRPPNFQSTRAAEFEVVGLAPLLKLSRLSFTRHRSVETIVVTHRYNRFTTIFTVLTDA